MRWTGVGFGIGAQEKLLLLRWAVVAERLHCNDERDVVRERSNN